MNLDKLDTVSPMGQVVKQMLGTPPSDFVKRKAAGSKVCGGLFNDPLFGIWTSVQAGFQKSKQANISVVPKFCSRKSGHSACIRDVQKGVC